MIKVSHSDFNSNSISCKKYNKLYVQNGASDLPVLLFDLEATLKTMPEVRRVLTGFNRS